MHGVGMELTKIGIRSGRSSPRVAPNEGGIIPVGVPVGCTELTRMLCAASSLANAIVSPVTPYLAAVYGICSGKPFIAPAELMLTKLPPPSATRCGTAAAQVFHVPIRFTSTTVRQ